MKINGCGLPPQGGEAYDRNTNFNKNNLHIILWTTWNSYHCLCHNYNISCNFKQKQINQ